MESIPQYFTPSDTYAVKTKKIWTSIISKSLSIKKETSLTMSWKIRTYLHNRDQRWPLTYFCFPLCSVSLTFSGKPPIFKSNKQSLNPHDLWNVSVILYVRNIDCTCNDTVQWNSKHPTKSPKTLQSCLNLSNSHGPLGQWQNARRRLRTCQDYTIKYELLFVPCDWKKQKKTWMEA